jgi:hypothetical protein
MSQGYVHDIVTALVAVSLAVGPAAAQEIVTEPGSGVAFATKKDDLSLLGVGLRTRTLFRVKVYAIALYVADRALSGPLAAHKGDLGSAAFYRDLVTGDFPKEIHLTFVRNLDERTIRQAMREALGSADKGRIDTFAGYFSAITSGQECIIRWEPGGTLTTTLAGEAKPPIADREFAAAVFGVWLGDDAIQDSIRKGLVSRAATLIR